MHWFERFYQKDFINVVGFASEEQTLREALFVKEQLQVRDGFRILDLCCGYGRHTHALSRLGRYELTGMDLSEDYLTIARSQDSDSTIRFVQGDMREIPYENQFDAVLNLFTSFGFFETDEENERVLNEVRRALKPGGLFLLDFENRFHFILNDVLQKGRYWEKQDEDWYVFENTYDVVAEREVFKVTRIQKDGSREESGYSIRLYSLPELKTMLGRNGFDFVQSWGDFDGSPYSLHSRRLIALSRKI